MGTLTPGKQADLIMLRTDRINVTPLNDPATAVVAGMDTGNVDTVMIAGRVMKRHGELLHVDWPAVKRMASRVSRLRRREVRVQVAEHLRHVVASRRPHGGHPSAG